MLDNLVKYNKKDISSNSKIKEILNSCFTKQKEFVLCKESKIAHCSRRASKSYSAGLDMIITGLEYPNSNILFCGLTLKSAKKILIKDIIKPINNKFKLNLIIKSDEIVFPNGSIIYVMGLAKDEQQADKLLGQKYKLIVCDEAQSYYNIDLEDIINHSLEPTLLDLNGRMIITGTSCDYLDTFFYKLTINKKESASKYGYHYFNWLVFDNPHVAPQIKAKIKAKEKLNPNYTKTKAFQQEWMSKWYIDDTKLVYKYKDYNFFNENGNPWELPSNQDLLWIMGVDVGYNDSTAIGISAYSRHDRHLYFVEAFKQKYLNTVECLNILLDYCNKRKYTYIVIDGADKRGLELYKERIKQNVIPAEKSGKYEYQQIFNNDLDLGLIRVLNQPRELILEEANKLVKDPSKPREDHPGLPNDLCDAFLYNFRQAKHFFSKDPIIKTEEEIKKESIRKRIEKSNSSGIFDRLKKTRI